MKTTEFILALNEKLSNLPSEEVEERLNFYSEMISDRIEDGIPEEEAVAAIGTVDEVAEQILADIPLSCIVKQKLKKRRNLGALEITLLAIGSPLWISLLAALFAVVISLYATVWSVVASLWACFASFVVFSFACLGFGVFSLFTGNGFFGVLSISYGIFLSGISIFAFFLCLAATKGSAYLMKKSLLLIKKLFAGKEKNND